MQRMHYFQYVILNSLSICFKESGKEIQRKSMTGSSLDYRILDSPEGKLPYLGRKLANS
jgi:hypothetical protein